MVIQKNNIFNKILVVLSIVVTLTNFLMTPIVQAASIKTEMKEGEFYYAGTSEGAYRVSKGVIEWLLEKIGEILDWILGLLTMIVRIVVVGWTALIEQWITRFFYATTGVPVEEHGFNVIQWHPMESCVTVEAIVYNRVPIFNINLFSNNKNACLSGTGRYDVVCEECYYKLNPKKELDPNRNIYAPIETEIIGKNKKVCTMDECSCLNCWKEMALKGYFQIENGKILIEDGRPVRKANAVTVIKDAVSKWYYIIRLFSIALMLIILIVIGIKMASTTIAEEKALYKRMIVDWIVGMILIFLIHYVMVFMINANEYLVDFIRDSHTGVTEIMRKEFGLTAKKYDDMEIGLYEAVRSRAYDPKLINGTTGMVLYVTLVSYTIKFIFIYFRRYLNIIILTVMAPGIAFSYAIQKVLTGKSQGFKNWLSEYFINTFIQSAHALIYTIFVSTALIISLDSIPGMILAFVFINFMPKADEIFRKMFKLTSESSEEAMNAPKNVKNMKNSIKSAVNFMTAGNLLRKSPITKAVTAPIRMAGTGAVVGASIIKSKIDIRKQRNNISIGNINNNENNNTESSNTKNTNNGVSQRSTELVNVANSLKSVMNKINPTGEPKKEFKDFLSYYNPKNEVGYDGEDAIDKQISALEKFAFENADNISEEDLETISKLRDKFDNLTNISTGDVLKYHFDKFLDKRNYMDYNAKTGKYELKYGFLGKKEYDRTQNKWVRRTLGDLVAEQLKSENLLGFTKEDKKIFKELGDLAKGTLLGMGSLLVGFGTVVTNPAVGMGLLANGFGSMINFAEKTGLTDTTRTYRPPVVDEKNKRFSFNRFNKGAKQNIVRSILANSEKENNKAVVENVRKNHKKLYRTLKLGGAGLSVAGFVSIGSLAIAPTILATGVALHVIGNGVKHYSGYSQKSILGKISRNHFKQLKELKSELVKDEIRLLSKEESKEMKDTYVVLLAALENSLQEKRENTTNNKDDVVEVVKLNNGEELKLDIKKDVKKEGYLTQKTEKNIIEEAVAEAIIQKCLNEISKPDFDPEKIHNEARKVLEDKLVGYGVLDKDGKTKIEDKIKGADKKLDQAIKDILHKEFGKELSKTESEDIVELTKNTDTEETNSEMSTFDRVLIKEVIREKIKNKEIQKISDISIYNITEGMLEARSKIEERRATSDVIEKLQNGKMSTDRQSMFGEASKLTPAKIEGIEKAITNIKLYNKAKGDMTQQERRTEKEQKIETLKDVLLAATTGQEVVQDKTNQAIQKSTKEIIEELFENKEQQEQVYSLIDNINNMKRLNKRGESAKMPSKNTDYHHAKSREKVKKAQEQHRDLIEELSRKIEEEAKGQNTEITKQRDGSREYKHLDGTKLNSKEVFGPVTDIIDLIKGL